ncbi:hypothetical protein GW17_00013092 [Ensete ventricosum]|nr:hypothetical protein GW17_00013092 [Ensete ventricosum]
MMRALLALRSSIVVVIVVVLVPSITNSRGVNSSSDAPLTSIPFDLYHTRTFLVFQSFGQHGRELITSEVALQLLSVLAEEHNILNMDPVSITKELDNIVIKVNHTAGTLDLFYIRIVSNG